jgi:hypothetical protein
VIFRVFLVLFLLSACSIDLPETERTMYKSSDGVDFGSGAREAPKGWSVAGTLATPDATGATPALSVSLQQIFSAVGEYTLYFELTEPEDTSLSAKNARAKALIEWSVGGNTITREVSVASGTSVTGVAESVRVVMTDDTIDNPGNPGYEYEVTASLAPGSRAAYTSVPLSSGIPPILGVTNGAPVTVPVPQGVGVALVAVVPGTFLVGGVNTNLEYRDLTVRLLGSSGDVLLDWKPPSTGVLWVPLVPGTASVYVACSRVLGIISTAILFGIDG